MAAFYRGVISRLDSDVVLYNLYRVPALKGTDREAREAFLRDMIAKDGNVRDSVTRRAMDAIENEVGSMGSAEKNALSDILEGASSGEIRAGWGHLKESPDYWDKEASLPIEAFAHFFSAYTANPESLAVLERYLPKSKSVFDDIVKSIE